MRSIKRHFANLLTYIFSVYQLQLIHIFTAVPITGNVHPALRKHSENMSLPQAAPTEPSSEQHSNHTKISQNGAKAGTCCQAPSGQTPGESRASLELLCFPSSVSGSELAQVSSIVEIFSPPLWLCSPWSTGTEGQQGIASLLE